MSEGLSDSDRGLSRRDDPVLEFNWAEVVAVDRSPLQHLPRYRCVMHEWSLSGKGRHTRAQDTFTVVHYVIVRHVVK